MAVLREMKHAAFILMQRKQTESLIQQSCDLLLSFCKLSWQIPLCLHRWYKHLLSTKRRNNRALRWRSLSDFKLKTERLYSMRNDIT